MAVTKEKEPPTLFVIASRPHKILPLIEDYDPIVIDSIFDICRHVQARLKRSIVIIDSYGHFALYGLFAKLILGASLVMRVRGDISREWKVRYSDATSLGERVRRQLGYCIIKYCLSTCDSIIYNSQHVRERLHSEVSSAKCEHVVYNPLTKVGNTEALSPRDTSSLPGGGFKLLTVTNMGPRAKIFPTLNAIVDWVPEELWEEWDLHWIVLGCGKHFETVRRQLAEHSLCDRVTVPGWVDNPKLYYDWCDVYIHITNLDAFPNATMEAMSCRKPVITNEESCGVLEQVFDGLNGFVVANEEQFLDRLRSYKENPNLRLKHGSKGAALVSERWTVESQKERMSEAINSILHHLNTTD